MTHQTDWFGEDAPRPWTLAEIYADLCGVGDLPLILDVDYERVRKWVQRRERINIPQPLRHISNVDIYSAEEWRGWYRRWVAKHNPETKWTGEAKGAPLGYVFRHQQR